jgi:hypothetical protein
MRITGVGVKSSDGELIAHVLSGLSVPVFAAGLDNSARPLLTVYTAFPGSKRKLEGEIAVSLLKAGLNPKLRLKVREETAFEEPASLEGLLQRFQHDRIVYDPLGWFSRAGHYVRFAAKLRAQIGGKLTGIYLEPVRRTVYLVLDRSRILHGQIVKIAELREIENAARDGLAEAFSGFALRALPSLRLGLSFPSVPLVPIDAASAPPKRRAAGLRAAIGVAASLAAVIGFSYPGSARAEGPAVSAPNAKVSVEGGKLDGSGTGIAAGSLTLPVQQQFGFQVDAAAGKIDGDPVGGVGAHLFWRDPDEGLLGAIASYTKSDGAHVSRVGGEGELYLGQFSILARGGYQFGNYERGNGDESGLFGAAELRWYATDDLVLGGGVGQDDDKTRGIFGAEFQPGFAAVPGLSFFADGEIGEDDYYSALAGIRYYFGPTKSLKNRHRQDDPSINLVTDSLNAANRPHNADEYGGVAAPPAP